MIMMVVMVTNLMTMLLMMTNLMTGGKRTLRWREATEGSPTPLLEKELRMVMKRIMIIFRLILSQV